MKVGYDSDTDTLDMIFREGKIAESDEDKPGIIIDYDAKGRIISIELLEASKVMNKPISVSFELASQNQ